MHSHTVLTSGMPSLNLIQQELLPLEVQRSRIRFEWKNQIKLNWEEKEFAWVSEVRAGCIVLQAVYLLHLVASINGAPQCSMVPTPALYGHRPSQSLKINLTCSQQILPYFIAEKPPNVWQPFCIVSVMHWLTYSTKSEETFFFFLNKKKGDVDGCGKEYHLL